MERAPFGARSIFAVYILSLRKFGSAEAGLNYFPSNSSAAAVIACTPVFNVGSGTGANSGE